jgi:hypothetical protein
MGDRNFFIALLVKLSTLPWMVTDIFSSAGQTSAGPFVNTRFPTYSPSNEASASATGTAIARQAMLHTTSCMRHFGIRRIVGTPQPLIA